MHFPFLDALNDVQREAATCIDNPVLILAGAGSGKTRVLTYRVAYLIASGIDPFRIMSLTFTNKAAEEMKERIISLVGKNESRNVWMGTFHSVFLKILRTESEKFGYPSSFTIYDTDDSKSLIRTIVKDKKLDDKTYNAGYIYSRISSAKMNLMSPRDYKENGQWLAEDKAGRKPYIADIYAEYWERCRQYFVMDFDDILYFTYILFDRYPEILYKYQKRFQYIMVDEYQDTNHAQYVILRQLAAMYENICVVGDDSQSIYAFRGANIQNILNFTKDYPDHRVFKLEQNYRSSSVIVEASNHIIENNRERLEKKIWTDNETGDKISLLRANSEQEEALMIVNTIFQYRQNYHDPLRDFAVLYRTNAQSRALEEAFRKLNIPYKVFGGLSFYKRKEIKDIIAYFRLVCNPSDQEALQRIINVPGRGIGDTTIQKLNIFALQNKVPVWTVLENIQAVHIDINSGIKRRLHEFYTLVQSFIVKLGDADAYTLANEIVYTTGYLKALAEDKSPDGVARIDNIEALLNGVKAFSRTFQEDNEGRLPNLSEYLSTVSLLTDVDEEEDRRNTDYVSLMTIHSAKGLEFPVVFVAGMEENLFPHINSATTREELEEERRLFYVAVTRAMKKLFLSHADSRYKYGDLVFPDPSRFIEEIDEKLFDIPRKFNPRFIPKKDPEQSQSREKLKVEPRQTLKFVSHSPASAKPNLIRKSELLLKNQNNEDDGQYAGIDEISEGTKVLHGRFGTGTVIDLEGSGPAKKATIVFEQYGKKQILLKFAKLKIVP